MSGRGLGHTGGTIDKMEAVPGTRTEPDAGKQFFKQVNEIGISVIGQSGKIAVADKKMYALRDVTATVGCIAADCVLHHVEEAGQPVRTRSCSTSRWATAHS